MKAKKQETKQDSEKKKEALEKKENLAKRKEAAEKRKEATVRRLAEIQRRVYSIIQNRMHIPHLHEHMEKAGLDIEEERISHTIMNVALFINFMLSFYIIYNFFILKPDLARTTAIFFGVWSLILILAMFVFWLMFYLFVDFRVRLRAVKLAKQRKISRAEAYKIELNREERTSKLIDTIEHIGLNLNVGTIVMLLLRFAIIVNLALNAYLFHQFSHVSVGILYTLIVTTALWVLGFILSLLLLWALFFIWLDLRTYRRKKEIEEVIPDFLQLTAANISAGMTIDRALWFAVRPRFGVLAKEIEDIAKSTIVGENLNEALLRFADKYDSELLKRSINLLIEGMESGGELGELLNRIAQNIQETRIIKKEMAANVTTYVIFITFATVVAAPLLFGLSTELIVIMKHILGNVEMSDLGGAGGMGSMFTISADAIALKDYQIFAITCLTVSSTASAALISIIKKGNIKEGLQSIPMFIGASLIIYFIAYRMMASLLGGMFG